MYCTCVSIYLLMLLHLSSYSLTIGLVYLLCCTLHAVWVSVLVYIRAGTKVTCSMGFSLSLHQGWDEGYKTTFKALSAKMNKYSKVCTCFYQCCSYLDWVQKASKTGLLLYNEYQSCSCCCFYLDLLGFSIAGLRNETEAPTIQPQLFWNMPTRLDCTVTSTHVQTLMGAWQQSFKGKHLASNAQQTNKSLNI